METETHTGPHTDTDKHRQEVDRHGCYYEKDPHDSQFIPMQQLRVEDLPSGYQSRHLVSYIQACADLLVAVLVNCVSDKRPERSPGSDKLYPCHDMRGSKAKREGTGYISGVYIFPDEHIPGFEICECTECRNSPVEKRKKQFAHVDIRTVTHLVFDEEEGNNTTCKGQPRDSRVWGDGFEFSNMRYVTNSPSCDWCLMTYVTHDMDFVNKLTKLITRRDNLKDILVAESLMSMSNGERGKGSERALHGKLNITISHSNERDKHVSIVQYEHVNGADAHSHSHINASAACVGSCGAPVQVIEQDWSLYAFEHTHSGHFESEVNYSSEGIGSTPFNHKHTEDKTNLHKSYENKTTEECWSPESNKEHEVDLKEHVVCDKNKGHTDFIPAPEFQMENLPPGFRNKNVMACIQAVLALTVLVSVRYTSKKRPKRFPFSDKPYTGNDYKGTKKKRTGTGLVHDIVRFPNEDSNGSETCPCQECKSSSSPQTQFAYVTVHSVAHVVFNGSEGNRTKCYLFFDKGSAPEFQEEVMELKRASGVWCDVSKDTSKMIFVTHNLPLINKLCSLVGHWASLQQKLEHGFIISSSKHEKPPSGGHSDSNHGSNLDSNLDSNLESNHGSNLDSNLDSNLESNHDSNLDSNHGSNPDSNLDSNHESNDGSNHESNLDSNHGSNLDSNHGSNLDSNHGSNLDSNHGSNLDGNHDSNLDSNHGSNLDSNHDSNYDSNHDSNYDSNHDSNDGSNLESNHGSNLESNHGSNHSSKHDSNYDSNHDSNHGNTHDSNHGNTHGLTVIASHPHGCSKHVSIGHCISMDATGSGYTECHYTTPTCPGCSGAYVFVVGKFWKCWNKHHYGI